eukprot:Gb_35541 [translate_table: standard]
MRSFELSTSSSNAAALLTSCPTQVDLHLPVDPPSMPHSSGQPLHPSAISPLPVRLLSPLVLLRLALPWRLCRRYTSALHGPFAIAAPPSLHKNAEPYASPKL